jgi:hypothetical protein
MKQALVTAAVLLLVTVLFTIGQSVTVTYNLDFRFADAEVPGGAVDGTNKAFTLQHPPDPAASLILTRNGLVQKLGLDYSLNGATVTFIPNVPQPGDLLQPWYRYRQ